MTIEREVTIAGQTYPVILSDETKLFRLRKQPGELLLAYGGKTRKNSRPTIHLAFTLLQTLKTPMKHSWNASSAATWLLPWLIAELTASSSVNFPRTIRLEPASAEDADGTFSDWNKREEYRKHQYRFAECGLWALERRADGVLVGKAGLTDGELGISYL